MNNSKTPRGFTRMLRRMHARDVANQMQRQEDDDSPLIVQQLRVKKCLVCRTEFVAYDFSRERLCGCCTDSDRVLDEVEQYDAMIAEGFSKIDARVRLGWSDPPYVAGPYLIDEDA
jgi:hypothetical protein